MIPGFRDLWLSPAAVQLWQELAAPRRLPGLSFSFSTGSRRQEQRQGHTWVQTMQGENSCEAKPGC